MVHTEYSVLRTTLSTFTKETVPTLQPSKENISTCRSRVAVISVYQSIMQQKSTNVAAYSVEEKRAKGPGSDIEVIVRLYM